MKGKAILAAMIASSLLFSGCDTENQWEKALGESAPPDPYKQAQGKIINEEKKKQEQAPQKIELAETATGQKTIHRAQYRPDLKPKAEEQKATLVIILERYDSCYEGLVRPYIEGRLLGKFDNGGKLTVMVAPGEKELRIFDSESVREVPLSLTAGKRTVITVRCEAKIELPAKG